MFRTGLVTLAFSQNPQAALLNSKAKKAAEKGKEQLIKNTMNYMLGEKDQNLGDFLSCTVCQATAATVDSYMTDRSTIDYIESGFKDACEELSMFQVLNNTVCPIVKTMGDQMLPALVNFGLSPDYACSNQMLD